MSPEVVSYLCINFHSYDILSVYINDSFLDVCLNIDDCYTSNDKDYVPFRSFIVTSYYVASISKVSIVGYDFTMKAHDSYFIICHYHSFIYLNGVVFFNMTNYLRIFGHFVYANTLSFVVS